MSTMVPFFDLPCPIWICDPSEAVILDCNAEAQRLLGRNHAEMNGHAPDLLGLRASFGAFVTIGFPEGPSFLANISRMEIEWRGCPAVMLAGKTAVVGAVLDDIETVALRDEAAAKALRLQNTIENMPDGFFLHDRHIRYLYANPIGKEMDGVGNVPDDELQGKSLWDIMPSLEPQLRNCY